MSRQYMYCLMKTILNVSLEQFFIYNKEFTSKYQFK